MVPLLLADRFLVVLSDEAVDLATTETVRIRPVAPTGRQEAATWLRRCPALLGLRHPHRMSLVDFGPLKHDRYFEAWACARAPCALDAKPTRPSDSASKTWRSRSDPPTGDAVLTFALTSDRTHETVARLEEVFDSGVSGRPRAVSFQVPNGPSRDVLACVLARTARLRGYVPVASRAFEHEAPAILGQRGWRKLPAGRHVLVLDACDGDAARDGGASLFFLSMGVSSERPHVWLRLEDSTEAGIGKRAVFAAGPREPLGVREESTAYVAGVSEAPPHVKPVVTPGPGGASAAARPGGTGTHDAVGQAIGCAIASGRHAQAERFLREWLGRCARRHDEAVAAEAALALGQLLLVRGRTDAAFRAFDEARMRFDRAGLVDGAVQAAVFIGLARTDAGRLGQAESALRGAGIAAAGLPAAALREFAGLALARCLYWQGRMAEASDCLSPPTDGIYTVPDADIGCAASECSRSGGAICARERLHGAAPGAQAQGERSMASAIGAIGHGVARACLASRVALATEDVASGWRFASEACERAARSTDAAELAAACLVKAAACCALGDLDGIREQVKTGLHAAREAHAPLRALRLRIVMARGLQLAGREKDAHVLLSRLSRLDLARLPRVVSLPLERVIRGESRPHVARTVAARVARPLSGSPTGGLTPPIRSAMVETVVDILRLCQSSDDEAAVLGRVASMLRDRVHAVAVACLGWHEGTVVPLAAGGVEHGAEPVARRAVESGLAIAPTSTSSGLEAAVPIHFAGAPVGAFTCRFAADELPEWPVVGDILAAAAAAVGPCLRTVLDRRAAPAASPDAPAGEIVGTSEAVASLRRDIVRAARAPFNVVIEGESGSGKELVARALHRLGPRRERPLCALNCAALTDDLVEAELFGHARGAFTGAIAERKGLFEEADHGVLVLDEVGELTARAQAKLLRAVQEGEVRRVGENFARPVDVRIVAATNRPLRPAVESGAFRRDLLYRLEVIRIVVPPLRARAEDIPLLAAHFWREATARVGSRCTLAPTTLSALARYDWPGNVRELQNVMAALAVSVGRRGSVGADQLPTFLGSGAPAAGVRSMAEARRAFETAFVRAALARAGGNRAQAACELGLTRQGLAKLMGRLGID